MRTLFTFTAVVAATLAAHASDTAYTALRTVGKLNGKEALNHIVEVRGVGGAPDPGTWRITLEDPAARGGIREMEIQRGKVVSERTPTSRSLTGAMDFNQLNLDSDGVFTVANEEAKKAGVLFDHADYTLHSGGHTGAPVWRVDLSAAQQGRVCTVDIAADTGKVLRRDMGHGDSIAPYTSVRPPPSDPEYRPRRDDPDDYDRQAPPPPPSASDDDYDGPGFFERLKNRFEKRGRQFDNFFNGRGWHQ